MYAGLSRGPHRFTVADMLERHKQDKAAILEALGVPYDGPAVVVTHHLPVCANLSPHGEPSVVSRSAHRTLALHVTCGDIKMHDIDTWICGHSHEGGNWTGEGNHGPIRFVMNQRGYPREEAEFDPALVIEVP